jgi:hypothetical protein
VGALDWEQGKILVREGWRHGQKTKLKTAAAFREVDILPAVRRALAMDGSLLRGSRGEAKRSRMRKRHEDGLLYCTACKEQPEFFYEVMAWDVNRVTPGHTGSHLTEPLSSIRKAK